LIGRKIAAAKATTYYSPVPNHFNQQLNLGMKTFQISLTTLLFCVLTLNIFAQTPQSPQGTPGTQVPQGPQGPPPPPTLETLKQQLQLTPDQEAKVKAIMDKYKNQIQQARNSTDPSVRHAGMAGAMDAQREEIRGVLTQAQNDKLDAMRSERGPRRVDGEMKREVEGDENPLRQEIRSYAAQNIIPVLRQQRQKLNAKISPEDQATLNSLRGDMKEKTGEMRSARQDGDRKSDDYKGKKAERQQVKGNIDQLAAKYSTDINQVLTEINPQISKWKQDIQAITAKYPAPANGRGKRMEDGSSLDAMISPSAILLLNPNKK
jgi:Spy/CpxP family protein refolding chaperone